MVTKIPITEAKNTFVQSVCIEFECLFDMPFGIMRTIRENFYDPGVFHKYWVDCDNYNLRVLLYDRKYYNPIIESSINEDIEEANSLYLEMISNDDAYSMILNKSPRIAMFNMVEYLSAIDTKSSNHMIEYTIICKNKMQANHVKQFLPEVRTSIARNYNFDIRRYDLVVVERYENIIHYSKFFKLENHTIWIPEFSYNMDKDEPEKPDLGISVFVADVNKVCTYEPYNNFIKPIG